MNKAFVDFIKSSDRIKAVHVYTKVLVDNYIIDYPAKDNETFEKHVEAFRQDLQALVDAFNDDNFVKVLRKKS